MHEPSDWQTDGLIVTAVTNKVGPLLCNLSVMLSFTENVDTLTRMNSVTEQRPMKGVFVFKNVPSSYYISSPQKYSRAPLV